GCLWGWLAGAVALLMLFLVTMIIIESILGGGMLMPTYGAHVGLVRIEGVIADSRAVIDDLRFFEDRGKLAALVIRIDSPGGGVAATQEITSEIARIRDSGIPVVASLGAIAASGGYYIACSADSVFANPGTLTGSIGVIMSFTNLEDLFGKIGISFEVVRSGEYKDIGSWSREMTDDERGLLQATVDDIHSQFVEAVAEGRGLSIEDVGEFADGRVFSGRQAVAWDLVDATGTLDDAIAAAGRMGGIEGEPRVAEPVKRQRLTLVDLVAGSLGRLLPAASAPTGALYLHRPSK
ncbi:signal peptide peptidase SppA, partial [bacterium]|nr:signal peptide peptidase SppA [bacterium]